MMAKLPVVVPMAVPMPMMIVPMVMTGAVMPVVMARRGVSGSAGGIVRSAHVPRMGSAGAVRKRRLNFRPDPVSPNAMGYWSSLGDELGERRRRLRRTLKPWRAGLIEFLILAGFTLGLVAPLIHGPAALDWRLGLVPPALFLLAYGLVDLARQRALAAGGEEEAVRRRFRPPTIAAAVIGPTLGLLVYFAPIWMRPPPPPPPVEQKSDFLPADPADVPVTGIVR